MIYSIAEAKGRFSELVRRAAYKGEAITIGMRGKPEVVLISFEELEKLRQLEDERDARLLEEAVRTSSGKGKIADLLAAWDSRHKEKVVTRGSTKRKAG